jgi:hypothetical protein
MAKPISYPVTESNRPSPIFTGATRGDAGRPSASSRRSADYPERSALISMQHRNGIETPIQRLLYPNAHPFNRKEKLARSNDHAINDQQSGPLRVLSPKEWSPPIPLDGTNPNGDMEPDDTPREQTLTLRRVLLHPHTPLRFPTNCHSKTKASSQKNRRDSLWPGTM